jgi:hypothetical protein
MSLDLVQLFPQNLNLILAAESQNKWTKNGNLSANSLYKKKMN